ncbi:MAG: tRNA uridine-5-carboxymethylaminomethyl(34) synthesis GTPase MnmE [Firmicutes bacterium]|jgi:tRNA modification GTPase|nr:tRNA uridine-5-carboxymethylaminomethyl(34) synthesis GTPase MnmE [Bacillota bacterium]HQD39206.1 tRNA uridine-5-carboxymethylaminomethyl(34) synthesis GTPase MnmE [Bacillota bacterium]
MEETIAAISTGTPGGIGIVRISGKDAWKVGKEILSWKGTKPQPRRMYFAKILTSTGETIDECLFVLMIAPNSYTGEDLLELHCHGGTVVLRRVLERCLEAGATLAKPGQFTEKAFLNGKLDLTQAEAVNDLICAKTQKAASMAIAQLEGSLSREIKRLRDFLLDALAQIEGRLDFPDEIETSLPEEVWDEIREVAAETEKLIARGDSGQILREGLPVSIIGLPNVGKSSLLNALLGTERAIVTDLPGTTRDVIAEAANIRGIPVVLRDTAGLRKAEDPVEKLGVELARRTAEEAALVLLVFDCTRPVAPEEKELLKELSPRRALLVANKSDLQAAYTPQDLSEITDLPAFFVSAKTGAGLEELKDAIAQKAMQGQELEQGLLVNARQKEALIVAKRALDAALAARDQQIPVDLVAIDLRAAVEKFGEITGENLVDGLLDRIFSNFCLGK